MAKKTERKVLDVTATSTAVGTAIAVDVAIVDGSGNQVTSFGGGSGGATIGAAVPATATAVAVKDNAGNLAYPVLDASNNLLVAVTGAGSGGTSSVDGAGYTAGTSAGTPLMGARDDTGTTVLAEDKIGIARLTQYRGVHGNLRDAVGNEIIQTLDYDTGGGTVTQGIVGIALPASGGPVAGGTATNPLQVSLTNTGANSNKLLVTPDLPALAATSTKQSDGTQKTQVVDGSGNVIGATSNALDINIKSGNPTTLPVTNAGTFVVQNTQTGTASQNVAQLAGTATDVNSGAKSAGTLRVVIATDQPALTNKLLVTPDLPSGASTAAKQPALGTAGTASSDVITVQGIASMTKLLVTPDSVALPANQSVNVAQVAGTNIVTAGVAGTQAVGGNVATNVAIGTNPINLGAQAISAENTAITATRMAQLVTDLVGKLIVLPYANPENFVSGAITSGMTGTTSTSLLGAPATGLRNYITQITVSNSHATVGTDIAIQDGNGGTTLYTIPAAAVYGGAVVTFPTPLRQPNTATAIYCANVTTGANTKVSASGYKGI